MIPYIGKIAVPSVHIVVSFFFFLFFLIFLIIFLLKVYGCGHHKYEHILFKKVNKSRLDKSIEYEVIEWEYYIITYLII
jgi:hypothetical protein